MCNNALLFFCIKKKNLELLSLRRAKTVRGCQVTEFLLVQVCMGVLKCYLGRNTVRPLQQATRLRLYVISR